MKKVQIIIVLLFAFGFFGAISNFAQSSCACSNSTCSASQGCPEGYIAVCTCSATGCSSVCNKEEPILDLIDEPALDARLRNESAINFGELLSRALGKTITFEPKDSKFRYEYSISNSVTKSHWEILEYLASNGTLKINNHDIEFWKGLRRTLLEGGEFKFCTGNAPVEMLVGEISFITGRQYSIVSSGARTNISGAVSGKSLNELLTSLGKMSQTTIVEK